MYVFPGIEATELPQFMLVHLIFAVGPDTQTIFISSVAAFFVALVKPGVSLDLLQRQPLLGVYF